MTTLLSHLVPALLVLAAVCSVDAHLASGAVTLQAPVRTSSQDDSASAAQPFEYYLLALSWPPTSLNPTLHGRARHLIHTQELANGFWTHGMWPSKMSGPSPEKCTTEVFDPAAIARFERSLMFYLRGASVTVLPAKLHNFWSHEWDQHGTCSQLSQLDYFLAVFQASSHTNVAATLAAAGITPSNDAPYTVKQVMAALLAKYPVSFNPKYGLTCRADALGRQSISEVRLCTTKGSLTPFDCSKQQLAPPADGRALGDLQAPAAACTGEHVWLPDYQDGDAVLHLPWATILIIGCAVALVLAIMVGGYALLQRWRLIPTLFLQRRAKVVHYDLVQLPVQVVCEALDMTWMWDCVPFYAGFVDDLPVGMGLKGGIARKLLKEKYGTPEPPGNFDVDCLLFIDVYTPEKRSAARETVVGLRLGGLLLEPQDVEVLSKEWLAEYFISRDVTQNEVLILKVAPNTALFFYTKQAKADCEAQLIRPCVHGLKTEFHMVWGVEEDGTPFTASQQVCRSLVRYLKGHGRDYAFDRATWQHYRTAKLTKIELFKVLKPFHIDDRELQTAVDHLVRIGFLDRNDVRKAGGVNLLWGLLLQEVNSAMSRFGGRMKLTTLDSDSVERWVDQKKATTAARLISSEMKSRRTGFVCADESVHDLGHLTFPNELKNYIRSGATFDVVGQMQLATDALARKMEINRAAHGPQAVEAPAAKASSAGEGGVMKRNLSEENVLDMYNPASKKHWKAVLEVANGGSGGGDAVWQMARVPSGAGSPEMERMMNAELQGEVERLRHMMAAAAGGSPAPGSPAVLHQLPGATGGGGSGPQAATAHMDKVIDTIQSTVREQTKRSNANYKGRVTSLLEHRAASLTRPGGGMAGGSEGASTSSGGGGGSGGGDGGADTTDASAPAHLLRYSQMGQAELSGDHAPGSFYNVMPTGGMGANGALEDEQYVPLISDSERPMKRRVQLWRLLRFMIGVMALDKRLLLTAYVLMLSGLMARLCLPRIEAAIFDAFNDLDMSPFKYNLVLAMVFIFADALLSLAGKLCVEMFTRKAMRTLFRRFFEHIIFQDLPFFERLSPGELMARTSGDSLTLRSIVSTTTYQIIEGSTLFLGSIAFIAYSARDLILASPSIITTFVVVLALNIVEAGLLGLWLRAVNLAVRQALGRMFGFTLDAFSRIDTVASLGLEPQLLTDYKAYAGDYFRNAFLMNSSIHFHAAFTYMLSACLRGAFLWFGGRALFSDLVTVGTLFALLRYCHWMQRGMKQASDAYARLMASLGSVERIVELHDRGVFGVGAGNLLAEPTKSRPNTIFRTASGGGPTRLPSNHGALMPRDDEEPYTAQWHAQGSSGGDDDADLERPLLRRAPSRLLEDAMRPNYHLMRGGVRMVNIHLTVRSKTDRLLLHDCCLEVQAGQAVLLSGDDEESGSGALSLAMLSLMPYKGYIAFQVPDAAVPAMQTVHRGAETSGSAEFEAGLLVDEGGPGWKWVAFSFRRDDARAVRSHISLLSIRSSGIFRTSMEDNIAVATSRAVSPADVRRVCMQANAHDAILHLTDGYGTVVGDGSGVLVGRRLQLQVAVARALLRQPRLLLVDDASAFSDAVGPARFAAVLEELCAQGCAVLISAGAGCAARFPFVTRRYNMHLGRAVAEEGDAPPSTSA